MKDAGGVDLVEAKSTSQARALGIENMAQKSVEGRGVMIDLHAHVGRERALIGYEELMRVLDADKVVVEQGDMVLLHTGFDEVLLEMEKRPDPALVHNVCAALNGRDQKLLDWITRSGLSALISDNYAVEAFPSVRHAGCGAALPLHEHCLFKLGVNLGELWHLSPLARWLREHKRYRFLLTAPPLRLPGAVGSPATPVATCECSQASLRRPALVRYLLRLTIACEDGAACTSPRRGESPPRTRSGVDPRRRRGSGEGVTI